MPHSIAPIMVTIKKAAELTGVSEHTLRAWERRYGLFAPSRTPSGYRVYDDSALSRISAMNELVQAGWAPRDAATEVARHQPWSPQLDGVDPYAELVNAAADLDATAVAQVLDEQFSRAAYEAVVDGWLMPAMQRVGAEWSAGRVSVAGEHLVSNVVMRRLSAAYEAAGRSQLGPPVVIGAPSGIDHELGLMAFAVAARRVGLPTIYLGAQVPLDAWREATAKSGARAAVTSVPRRRDVPRVARVVEHLGDLPVWVGGRYQHLTPPSAHRLGHRIGEAAALLAGSDA